MADARGGVGDGVVIPQMYTDPQLGVAQVEVLVQQLPQGAKSIFRVIHKEVAQLCGKDREGLGYAGILHHPSQVLGGTQCPRPYLLGEVQSGSTLACLELPAQDATVEDVLRRE